MPLWPEPAGAAGPDGDGHPLLVLWRRGRCAVPRPPGPVGPASDGLGDRPVPVADANDDLWGGVADHGGAAGAPGRAVAGARPGGGLGPGVWTPGACRRGRTAARRGRVGSAGTGLGLG